MFYFYQRSGRAIISSSINIAQPISKTWFRGILESVLSAPSPTVSVSDSAPQYEGEKDTRGPADFSGNAAKQLDDAGDGDDDDADDDDGDSGIRGTHKRRGDGRLKQPPPLTMGGPEVCVTLISKLYHYFFKKKNNNRWATRA